MIVYSHYNRLGTIDKNTEAGIYGTIESAEKLFLQQEMVPVAERGEILVIEITDQRLLDATGGIIQGMSGSPILQNGKLIGAVTHVFVQDSAKGYGIFIENMLSNLSA